LRIVWRSLRGALREVQRSRILTVFQRHFRGACQAGILNILSPTQRFLGSGRLALVGSTLFLGRRRRRIGGDFVNLSLRPQRRSKRYGNHEPAQRLPLQASRRQKATHLLATHPRTQSGTTRQGFTKPVLIQWRAEVLAECTTYFSKQLRLLSNLCCHRGIEPPFGGNCGQG